MGIFDKVVSAAKNTGSSIATAAVKTGSSIGVAAQDQSELAGLKMQVNIIEQELEKAYSQVGRIYIEYVMNSGEMPGIDVSDILRMIDPKMLLFSKLFALNFIIISQNKRRYRIKYSAA